MSQQSTEDFLQRVTHHILSLSPIDAIYLYGSRAKGTALDDSDWDIAILYTNYEPDLLERAVRPQLLESQLDPHYPETISIVDLREVPVPLQWNIIQGVKLYDRWVPAVRRMEHAIISAWEKDYER